jgi:hypothetical protein
MKDRTPTAGNGYAGPAAPAASAPIHQPRGHGRRERLLARWRLSTVMAAVVALAAIAAILAAAFSLGGFGVPTDASPQAINAASVPFGLLSKTAPNPASPDLRNHRNLYPIYLWFILVGPADGHPRRHSGPLCEDLWHRRHGGPEPGDRDSLR